VYFRKALELKPNYPQAQYGICKAYIQIAAIDRAESKTADREVAKLYQLSPTLAAELEEYRKHYVAGITGGVPGGRLDVDR
jgi:hypothetical protein